MPSRPTTPGTIAPEIMIHIEAMVATAEECEGSAELGPVAEDLCRHYRALAICLLADHADVDGFFHWLLHSPLTLRHYLQTVSTQGLGEPEHDRASFVDPVLDAAAARAWKLAATVATLQSATWLEDEEYEDDFCYGEFLRRLVVDPDAKLDDLLARWWRLLKGGQDVRLEIARAIDTRDAAEVESSLQALLRENEAKARKLADPNLGSPLASDYPFFPNRWVSIEGLALLAIAERRGITLGNEFDTCPRVARAGVYAPFRPLSYPQEGLD